MAYQETAQALATITDEGLFERIATAVLREAHPHCRALSHPGINTAGKTVKAPLDGACYVLDADPPHLIAVHHTTTASSGLRAKWLHDPALIKSGKSKKSTAPPGDLIKTAEIVAEEKARTPNLQATLILTTNVEPDVKLINDVTAAGRERGLTVEIWSRSRLCHVLDHSPTGQSIRALYLGIEQELLSPELFHTLSEQSLALNPLESPEVWVDRALDDTLRNSLHRDVTFLVAESGLGKSVACHRLLAAHVEKGGFGLILSHAAIASAASLEQAIVLELRQLYPLLSSNGPSVFAFCSSDNLLLLIVEDINQAGQDAPRLAEKIANWSRVSDQTNAQNASASLWRLICPVWPESLVAVREQARQRIDQLSLMAKGFSEEEGANAVLARAHFAGYPLSSLHAQEIASALGHDPLLIALHDPSKKPESHLIIEGYIDRSLERAAADDPAHTLADYGQALRMLAAEMLLRRKIELDWLEVAGWFSTDKEFSSLLARIARKEELLRLVGPSRAQRLVFRHDRVRDWLLAEGVAELYRTGRWCDDLVAEPYFAEVLGAALAHSAAWESMLDPIARVNPLALFHAFRLICQRGDSRQQAILKRMTAWLSSADMRADANAHLRGEALGTLARTDSPDVPALVAMFPECTDSSLVARFRNGDVSGGIKLCNLLEPGIGAPWRDVHIEHAKLRYGGKLVEAVAKALRQPDMESSIRVGALRLAGHIAHPSLAEAIEACWEADPARTSRLTEYLWAFAECCGDDPARYLGPACDAWASLPDTADQEELQSLHDGLAAHGLRWAFRKWPPVSAIGYFISRSRQEALRWPIISILQEIDHPPTVLFVAGELAKKLRRLEGTNSFSLFLTTATDYWQMAQEDGRPMSKASRDPLLALWQNSGVDKYLREASLSLWSATTCADDIPALQTIVPSDDLFEQALKLRLQRGDQSALPELLKRVDGKDADCWWGFGRYMWSPDLTEALDAHLASRASRTELRWGDSFNTDWITSQLIMRLPTAEAERLLLKHWSHLRFSPLFIQTALYTATMPLQELVASVIKESPNPALVFEHLTMRWGCWEIGHPGITSIDQLLALESYLHSLSSMDINILYDVCNIKGWFDLRRKLIDNYMTANGASGWWDAEQVHTMLDEQLDKKHAFWLEHRIDDFLKAGVAWDDLCAAMATWLKHRYSRKALQLVASALAYKGTRKDLALLTGYSALGEAAEEILTDTSFAVCRRSLQ